jgi:hypothetical protein
MMGTEAVTGDIAPHGDVTGAEGVAPRRPARGVTALVAAIVVVIGGIVFLVTVIVPDVSAAGGCGGG